MDGFFYSSFKPSVVSGQDEAKIMERLFCVSKVNLAQKVRTFVSHTCMSLTDVAPFKREIKYFSTV